MTDIYQNNQGPLRLTDRHMIEPSLPKITLRFTKGDIIEGKLLAINKQHVGISHYISFGICDTHKISIFPLRDLSAIITPNELAGKQINNMFRKEGLFDKLIKKVF